MKILVYTFVAFLLILAIKEVKTELQTKPSLEVMADSLIKHPELIDNIKWYAREDRNGNVSLVPYVDSIPTAGSGSYTDILSIDTIPIKNNLAICFKIRHSAPHDLDTTKLFTNHSKIK